MFSKSVLTAIFNRRGEAGKHTQLFDQFSKEIQEEIVTRVKSFVRSEEEFIILLYRNSSDWFLITNVQIITLSDDKILTILYSDLKRVEADFSHVKNVRDESIFSHLKITTITSDEYLFKLEGGRPFFGIWNVLSSIVGLYSRTK